MAWFVVVVVFKILDMPVAELKTMFNTLSSMLVLADRGAETACQELPDDCGFGTLVKAKGYRQCGTEKVYSHHLAWFMSQPTALDTARKLREQHAAGVKGKWDISHLCHNKLCHNLNHLCLELTQYNKSRNYCPHHCSHNAFMCHHDPPCFIRGPYHEHPLGAAFDTDDDE